MFGWGLCAAIAGGTLGMLALLRFPTTLASLAMAATLLGAAGYAWQGHPALAGAPVAVTPALKPADDENIAMRSAMLGRYGSDAGWFIPADAMARVGADRAAARFIQGGINRDPTSIGLWTELGTIIARHDQAVSPAALLAFRHAMTLAPNDPAPWYFLGQAQTRAGDFTAARFSWNRALRLTPQTAPYRSSIIVRAGLLDRYVAMTSDR